MAGIVFKVSEKQWKKFGLPPEHYKKLLEQGFHPVWMTGPYIALKDLSWEGDSEKAYWGKAHTHKETITSFDAVFKAKYTELVGEAPVCSLPALGDFLVIDSLPDSSYPAPDNGSKKTGFANLASAEKAGQIVNGTSNTYTVYMLSSDCNLAFRRSGTAMSIRAEGFSTDVGKALAAWGMSLSKTADGRPYASVHLSNITQDTAVRTLGSLAASVLSSPPSAILPKGKI